MFFHIFVFFSSSPDFSSRISPQLFMIETSNLVCRFTTASCIVGTKMGILLFFPIFVLFSFSPDILWKISPQLFKIETSNLVQAHNDKLYHGIENGPSPDCSSLYLFFFLSLQIFRQRYLHNRLWYELLIWYTGSQRQVVSWDWKWAFSYLFFPIFFFLSLQIFRERYLHNCLR